MLLPPNNARVLGQGITGSEGSVATQWMQEYGTKIVAGVTPGKGGQTVGSLPIFNSVQEAVVRVGKVDAAVQFVPPLRVKEAAIEVMDAGIKFILISAEKVPTKDAVYLVEYAKRHNVSIIGPSAVGLISPHKNLKLGSIGGATPDRVFVSGNVALVSKSGGMTSELGLILKNAGFGVSWAVGIGGDRIIGTDFVDFLHAIEQDPQTKCSVIFGELGGTYEEKVAHEVCVGKLKKPIIAFIAGEFTMSLPSEVQFGHAGAIIEGDRGLPQTKRRVLREAGVLVADNLDQIPGLVKQIINNK